MLLRDHLSINTFDKGSLSLARDMDLGLEVEEYLWADTETETAYKREQVSGHMVGFSKFSFHGTAVSRDAAAVNRMVDEQLLCLYNESYEQARYHGIHKIVYHSNYLSGAESRSGWIGRSTAFWKGFLQEKPKQFHVYLENFIDDTPDLLAWLCDEVGDPRFQICLDIGHAGCNSDVVLSEWVAVLGKRIGHVHLHDNDGRSDKHWPLGQGVLQIAQTVESLLRHNDTTEFVLECGLEESLEWLNQNRLL